MALRYYMVEGKYRGAAPAKVRMVHAELMRPLGNSYFCTSCGKLWAQCAVDNAKHMVWCVPCGSCPDPDGLRVPGSTLLSWEGHTLDDLPDAMVTYELMVHLRWVASRFDNPIASAAQALLQSLNG
jgi:hypothetical protein